MLGIYETDFIWIVRQTYDKFNNVTEELEKVKCYIEPESKLDRSFYMDFAASMGFVYVQETVDIDIGDVFETEDGNRYKVTTIEKMRNLMYRFKRLQYGRVNI